jgi:hypothetical protein
MPGVIPRYQKGPVTFTANAAITGGQLVDPAAGGTVAPAAAGSNVCLGVAVTDAIPAATSQAPTVPGASVAVNLSPIGQYVGVASEGVWPVTYAASATFGQRLITAANGQVTPAAATPDARQVIGICYEPAGVTVSGTPVVGAMLLSIS